MDKLIWALAGFTLVTLILSLTGCTTTGKPMRLDPDSGVPKKDAWYIEGTGVNGTRFSCSFVEFDGRGDYISFEQHQSAWKKVKELAEQQKILLVFYCHGWKNNSQSGDVAEFNEFLSRLSAAPAVGQFGYRVHGIYLGWRGNLYHPYVQKTDPKGAYAHTTRQFGEPIISEGYHRKYAWIHWIPEQLSYWSRRSAAEHKVSSIPIARTIYTCASLAKAIDREKSRKELIDSSRVMVMGHSFGALLLERALNATLLDPLTDQWAWLNKHRPSDPAPLATSPPAVGREIPEDRVESEVNPLPLDFILLVNSAAPAIYSKTMRDFLAAHYTALQIGSSNANTPILISITSSADKATGQLHPIANVLSPLYPSLRHSYTNLLKVPATSPRRFHQSTFYKRTSGHQPLLVDHWIVANPNATERVADHDAILNENLNYATDKPFEFLAMVPGKTNLAVPWKLTVACPDWDKSWHNQFGELSTLRSSYWFVRCNKRLIRGHNDVWSDTAAELYAALYRLVEWTRLPRNQAQVGPMFREYWHPKE